jgi:hypothetical protein
MFDLQPSKMLQLTVAFLTPDPENKSDWPDIIRIPNEGRFNVAFANGKMQHIDLLGMLIRPRLFLQTQKPSKNTKGQDEIDLGMVNTQQGRTLTFFISNETAAAAHWQLNYVKFPMKQTLGQNTKTALEKENLEATDDPEVFQFSHTSVSFLHHRAACLDRAFR